MAEWKHGNLPTSYLMVAGFSKSRDDNVPSQNAIANDGADVRPELL